MAVSIPMRCARRHWKSTFPRAAPCLASASNSTARARRWPGRTSARSRWSSSMSTTSRTWCGRRARRSARPCCRCRREPRSATSKASKRVSGGSGVLTVEGLVKRFGGFTAVNNVSFRVEQGEILGLIGPNGSGKSTIFNMLSGTLVPTAGSIEFDGAELSGIAPHRIINRGIGRTFQIPRPFHRLTIFENVALAGSYGQGSPSRAKADEAAERALAMVGLPTDRHASVDGLGAAGLKKLELAKALATGPKLLLADESLGGLDETEMDQAADMLRKIRGELGITIIWVEHIMGVLMRVVDHVMVLDHGEKISEGLPSAVVADPRVIEVYLGTDADSSQVAAAEPRRGAGGPKRPAGREPEHARTQIGRRGLRQLSGTVRRQPGGEGGRGGRRDRP